MTYSANNVIVGKSIVLISSCNVGDCSCNVRGRACFRKIYLRFLPCVIVRDRAVFRFVPFFTERKDLFFKKRQVLLKQFKIVNLTHFYRRTLTVINIYVYVSANLLKIFSLS